MTIRCSATCGTSWRLSSKASSCSSASVLTGIPVSFVVAVARVGVGLRTYAPPCLAFPNWTLSSTGRTASPRSSLGGMSTGSYKEYPTAWGSGCKSRVAWPHRTRVPSVLRKSIPSITRSNMEGITNMGKSTAVPANVTGGCHNFVTSRHDRSANAILVTTSRTSPARATRFAKLSLVKLLDAPGTNGGVHPSPSDFYRCCDEPTVYP